MGRYKAKYSRTASPKARLAPDLGEHTEMILKDIVGLDQSQIDALAQQHATTPDPKSYSAPAWLARHKWKSPRSKL